MRATPDALQPTLRAAEPLLRTFDDEALIAGEQEWISELIDCWRSMGTRCGAETEDLARSEASRQRLLRRHDHRPLPRVAAPVSVLSPRYAQSEWRNRELKEFCRVAERSGGVRIGDKSRIFKVVKTPVGHERLPEEVQLTLGYEFRLRQEGTSFCRNSRIRWNWQGLVIEEWQ